MDWHRADLPPLAGPASLVAVAAGPDGTVLAAGAITGPDGRTEPALWRRDAGGGWGDPTTPDDLPRGLNVLPRGLAGGPAGFMLAGSRGTGFEIWTSPDGERWRRSSDSRIRVPPLMAVGEEFVALVGSPDPEVGTVDVLASVDGDALAKVDQIGGSRPARVDDAVYVQGRYLAVGADHPSPEHDFSPATWISDGPSTWSDGPRLEGASSGGTTAGSWAGSVAADPEGRALVTSPTGVVWSSGEDEDVFPVYGDPLPSASRVGGWVALLPAGAPTVFTSDRILGAGDDGWDDRAGEVVPRPRGTVEVTGVAHGPGGFVAVGVVRRDDPDEPAGANQGVIWRSPDGRAWERLPTDPTLARTLLLDVAPYEGGLVAVGLAVDADASRSGRVFVSADGSEWEAVDGEGLRPPEGGIHQLESVVAYREGFIATGFGSDGTSIAPLILVSSDGTHVERADVPPPSTGDRVTLGACAAGGTAVVVGTETVESPTAVAWRSIDGVSWDRLPMDRRDFDGLIVCSMSEDGAIVAAGRLGVADDTGVIAGVATDASLELRPLPDSGFGDLVTDVGWVDDVPVIVGQPTTTDPVRGALVWLATSHAALEWTYLTNDAFNDLAVHGATGVAADENVVVITGNTLTGGAAWTASTDDLLDR
jgi:hypothetical protein